MVARLHGNLHIKRGNLVKYTFFIERNVFMLIDVIKQAIIKNDGAISFEQFMSLCLYSPGFGYYSGGGAVFGEGGDFITAPEISPLYGKCLANQIADVYQKDFDVLELGAGTGKLALDILQRLDALNALPNTYYILEVSGSLKARQQAFLMDYPALFKRCQWLDSWPKMPIKGAVLANEVLDAMPATLFRKGVDATIEKAFVMVDEQQENTFHCLWQTADKALTKTVNALGPLPVGYQSEINESIAPWLASLSDSLSEGLILLIDYGFDRSTYYHPDRSSGTLMCHYQHKSHPDPFLHLGEQDMTAHVDFTAVAEAAFELGFDISGYTHQAAFLIGNGITNDLDELSEEARFKANHAIKMLTMPQEMGELFKVMALTKQCDAALKGFELIDQRMKL